MTYTPSNPLIIQSDNSLLLEVDNPLFEAARDELIPFAELLKSPEHIHTYRITPVSLWNAAACGMTRQGVLDILSRYTKYEIPEAVIKNIEDCYDRYGTCRLRLDGNGLLLEARDDLLMTELLGSDTVKNSVLSRKDDRSAYIDPNKRGLIKQALITLGYPVEDLAGFEDGESFPVRLRETAVSGEPFLLRSYQEEAIQAFHAAGGPSGGSGVVVLPCGAGKTVVGIGAMSLVSQTTLILVTNVSALRQWKREIIDKTHLKEDDIGEYSGIVKDIRPVTIATYQILTYRKSADEPFPHMSLFQARSWGLIIYDEVHLLPAPVFRETTNIQSRRRLGLTATLIREDGLETDVFSLIGPKKFDIPWRLLEKNGWIACAECHEIRVEIPRQQRMKYAGAKPRLKYRIAAENPDKLGLVKTIIDTHHSDLVLVIGQFISQLKTIARQLSIPIITGLTPIDERERIYDGFRGGRLRVIAVSKVANFAIDLPEANVAIQVSGTYGSRQEEAQRLGRILRPKSGSNKACFYTLVSKDTVEEQFAAKRQLFLTEQGYRYFIKDSHHVETLNAI